MFYLRSLRRPAQRVNRGNPPDLRVLEKRFYKEWTEEFFEEVSNKIGPLKEFFDAGDQTQIVRKYRTDDGGHILFRPVGLRIFVEVIAHLVRKDRFQWRDAVGKASELPENIEKQPYAGVIWLNRKMEPRNRVLARNVLLKMLGARHVPQDTNRKYAEQLGVDPAECQIPEM